MSIPKNYTCADLTVLPSNEAEYWPMTRPRFDIDHGELPSRQITVHQIGTSYLWIGRTGKLVQILNPGDPGYEENAKIVFAALHPNETTK